MIVLQSGFTGTSVDLNHPRLCWRKLAGTISASSAAEGFNAAFAYSEELVNAWKPTAVPADWTITFPAAAPVSYVGIGAHTLGSSGATVELQRLVSGLWVTFPGCALTPTDDAAILFLIAPIDLASIRIRITGAVAEIGYILTGLATEIPRMSRFTGLPITESQRVEYRDNTSMTGKPLGRTVQRDGLEFDIEIKNLPEAFRAGEWAPFREAMERSGRQFFFYAPKPQKYPDEVALAWQREPAPFERTVPNFRLSGSVSMTCGGYRQ
jgi:hypothetical protein